MKFSFLLLALLISATAVAGQKIEKPALVPKECTEPQKAIIREGVVLHDTKKYSEAIEKYQQVMTENPDCTLGIYELAMTYYAMGEKTKAMEIAYRGSKYKSEQLPLFYLTMANVIDDVGKSDEAVKIYRDAIKMLKDEKDMIHHLSSVHYNLGVTLVKQKKYPEARAELKKAVEYNQRYASPHFLLSIVYNGTKYKVPAFLAAARFLSLEPTTQRSEVTSRLIQHILAPAPKNEKTGNIDIFINLDAPKDEGDFGMFELFLGTLTMKDEKDKNKTEEQRFVDAVGTLIALVSENKELKSTFVGKYYVPFLAEAKKRGYSEVLGYLVLRHTGNEPSQKWLVSNEAKLKEFLAWSKGYSLPN